MMNRTLEAAADGGAPGRARPGILAILESGRAYHIPLLLLVALASRMVFLLGPGPIILSWRPADMAGIALNYYRYGFHFLSPQVNWGGNGPGYVETEFPIIPFLTALLYRVFGLHEWLTLIIPLLSALGLVAVTYLFARRFFGPAGGLAAGLFTAVSPTLSALTSSLWPDPPMVFCGALGLYALTRWAEEDSPAFFILGALSASLAILLKLTALYIGVPILYLCLAKYGAHAWKSPRVWLLGTLILVPVAAWYAHAHMLYLEYHNTFGIISGGYSKFATAAILLDPGFYTRALTRIMIYHLTAFAFAMFLYGMASPGASRYARVLHAWVGAVAFYILVAARGVVDGHYQYLLPIVPPAMVLAGGGTVRLVRYLASRKPALFPLAAVLMTLLFAGGVAAGTYLYLERDRYSTPGWENDRQTGLAVGRVTPPGSLIVVVDTQMDDFTPERSMTPPQVFYFSDRRGWYVSLAWLNESTVEKLRESGARFLAVTANARTAFDRSTSTVGPYLRAKYARVLDGSEGLVFDLGSAR